MKKIDKLNEQLIKSNEQQKKIICNGKNPNINLCDRKWEARINKKFKVKNQKICKKISLLTTHLKKLHRRL